jgi:hypothetical protein
LKDYDERGEEEEGQLSSSFHSIDFEDDNYYKNEYHLSQSAVKYLKLNNTRKFETKSKHIRSTKDRKHFKLKFLLRNKDIGSMTTIKNDKNKDIPYRSISFLSGRGQESSNLYIKYNIFKRIEQLLIEIRKRNETKAMFKSKPIERIEMIEIARPHRSTKQFIITDEDSDLQEALLLSLNDSATVVNLSLKTAQSNPELVQNYDEIYLQFLISLQHREITPEDYEELSRLDELVKKQTLSEHIINKLKSDLITNEIASNLKDNNLVCGICLENYIVDQLRRELPCGHRFHANCIDHWLRTQSTNCPIDKISVEVLSTSCNSQNENKCDDTLPLNKEPSNDNYDDDDDESDYELEDLILNTSDEALFASSSDEE